MYVRSQGFVLKTRKVNDEGFLNQFAQDNDYTLEKARTIDSTSHEDLNQALPWYLFDKASFTVQLYETIVCIPLYIDIFGVTMIFAVDTFYTINPP